MTEFKKILILLICIISFTNIYSQDKIEYSVSMVGGCIGTNIPISVTGVYGVSVSINNVYLSGMGRALKYGHSSRLGKWEDRWGISFNMGYFIKLEKHFELAPIFGFSVVETGIVDGYDWNVNGGGYINNDFTSNKEYCNLLFGYVFRIKFNPIVVDISCSNNSVYGGLGILF